MSFARRTTVKHIDILTAKQALDQGGNISEILRRQKNLEANTPDVIELSYDLQAGAYIRFAEANATYMSDFTAELAAVVEQYLTPDDTLLDIGTGEMTTLSWMARRFTARPRQIFAFDISWSRIHKGLAYAEANMGDCFDRLTPFVGDIGETPLRDKSVNVAVTNHALEPNGGRLADLLSEIFRVTRDRVILFEPCYEINSAQGKKRMDALGYIKGVDAAVAARGGRLLEKIKIKSAYNPLNPTVGFVIEPPAHPAQAAAPRDRRDVFAVPGTDLPLERVDGFYFSNAAGLSFPVLKSIPVLKSSAAILSTALASR